MGVPGLVILGLVLCLVLFVWWFWVVLVLAVLVGLVLLVVVVCRVFWGAGIGFPRVGFAVRS